ncbi:phospholipase D-like domain-containing protein [Sabulibacter ruber]|uniref:phospholipase D-like domain-containing protein n=1 Tax=Sabulibacter ruber TaxID=2811901 RepID=UPI001A973392|nr:phospholipase D-like domain-containing protein [Sabulibacter ruber]
MAFRFPFFSSAASLPCGAYFSPGEDCLRAILQCINSAKSSLKICVFTISDDRISQAILNAHRSGVNVQLISDNEKLFDKGSDIRQLAQAGLKVKIDNSPNHMHHKFAVIDQKFVLTGSYNWTRSAALYNHENVLVTSDSKVVAGYNQEFNRLWKEMTLLT